MSRSASATQRKSWKQTAATRRKGSSGAKRKARWGFTLLALGLLALFAYLMFRPTKPRTYFVQLPILKYDRMVPPIEYVSGDFAPLLPLPEETQAILHTKSLDVLQTTESVDEFASLFKTKALLPKDILILFVSAHGISHEGKPYIACSNFLRDSDTGVTGIYPLADFLDHVDQCEASAKLLVLDTGRLQYDPRIGLLVNEFPLMLEEEIKKHADPKLFVLSGTGMMQYPNVLPDQGRTLFPSLVVEGLMGAADSKELNRTQEPDDQVMLSELYKYVFNRMTDYFPQESGLTQTPYLMQGGTGVMRDFSEIEKHDTFLISLHAIRDAERAEQRKREEEEAAKAEAEEEARRDDHSPQTQSLARGLLAPSTGSLAFQQPTTSDETKPAAEPAAAEGSNQPANEGQTPSGAEPANSAAPAPSASTDKPIENTSTENNPAKEKPSVEESRLQTALHEAWSQRDKLQSRDFGQDWSPVDFAPHYWRLMNERLLDCERRYLAGDDYDLENLAIEVEGEVSGLRELAGQMASNRVGRDQGKSSLVSDHLLAAWRSFVNQGSLKANYESAADSVRALKQARLDYHDFLHRAVYYVRWYNRNSFGMADSAPGQQEITAYLGALRELQQLLNENASASRLSVGDLAAKIRPLQNVKGQLDDIVAEQLRQSVDQLERGSDDRETPAARRRLLDLLQTPLLSAGNRSEALRQLLRNDRKPPYRSEFNAHAAVPRLMITSAQWRALSNRLRLQAHLIRLADDSLYQVIDQQLLSISTPAPKGEQATAELLQKYRELGSRFSKFYRVDLPQQIAAGKANAVGALRLLDARDAEAAGQPGFPLLLPLESNKGPRTAQVQLTPESRRLELKIDPADPQPLQLDIKYTGENSSVATLDLAFNSSWLGVRNARDGRELEPGRELSVSLLEDGNLLRGELLLEVWAKADTSTADLESALKFNAVVINRNSKEKVSTHSEVTCILPNKNFVELLVQRNGAPSPHEDRDGAITLEPFPNRASSYLMWLQNHSGEPKQVTAKLLAIPKPSAAAWAPGRLFGRGGRRFHQIDNEVFVPGRNMQFVNSNVQVLATTKPFALPVDVRSETPIPFQTPGSEPPAEGAPPPVAPAEEPEDPDISHGLVMVITDTQDPRNFWVKWIELRPQSPAKYMTADVTYDATLEQIQVAVRPRTDDKNNDGVLDLLPRSLNDNPIDIFWDVDASQLADRGATKYGQYKGVDPTRPVLLKVNGVKSDRQKRKVWLTIDGYPRAMAYTIECDDPPAGKARREGEELRQSVQRVKLQWLNMPSEAYKKMFFYTPGGQTIQKLAIMAKDRQKEAVFLDEGQLAYFPAAKETAPVDFQEITARVEIDAPQIAFDSADLGSDVIEIGIGGKEQRFYSDRQIETHLLAITPDGQLRLSTTVDDYQVNVNTQGLSHIRTDFVARLRLRNEVVSGSKPNPVFFDDHPPELTDLGRAGSANEPVPKDANLDIFVTAKAPAGIDRVEFALDRSGKGDWAILDPQTDRTEGLLRIDHKFTANLSTEDLVPGKRYNVLVRAFDRIGLYPSETQKLSFSMARAPAPVAPDNQPKKETFGTVAGAVSTGSYKFPSGEITVVLQAPGETTRRVKNSGGGSFRFEKVKVGPEYKLSAEGKFQFKQLYGELEGIRPTEPGQPLKRHRLNLERDTRPQDLPQS